VNKDEYINFVIFSHKLCSLHGQSNVIFYRLSFCAMVIIGYNTINVLEKLG